MPPGAILSDPTYAARVTLLVEGAVAARLRRLVSTLQLLQVRQAIAAMLNVDEAAVSVMASTLNYELSRNTAVIHIDVEYKSLSAAQSALVTMGNQMGSISEANTVLDGVGLVLKSPPTFDVIEKTNVVQPMPAIVIVLSVAGGVLVLLCCWIIWRCRRGKKLVPMGRPVFGSGRIPMGLPV